MVLSVILPEGFVNKLVVEIGHRIGEASFLYYLDLLKALERHVEIFQTGTELSCNRKPVHYKFIIIFCEAGSGFSLTGQPVLLSPTG